MDFNLIKWISKPSVGSLFSILSSISFFVLCMLLPLIGPAGSKVEHNLENKMLFLFFLIISIIFVLTAFISKKLQLKDGGLHIPIYLIVLLILNILILLIFLLDGFSL